MKGSNRSGQSSDSIRSKDESDPFHIPSDYTWVDTNEKKRRMKAKRKSKKQKKHTSRSENGSSQLTQN